jgi:hypothetical protein
VIREFIVTKNDITGDRLVSKIKSDKFDSGWDVIWGKKESNQQDINYRTTHPSPFNFQAWVDSIDTLPAVIASDCPPTIAVLTMQSRKHLFEGTSNQCNIVYAYDTRQIVGLNLVAVLVDNESFPKGSDIISQAAMRLYSRGVADIVDLYLPTMDVLSDEAEVPSEEKYWA